MILLRLALAAAIIAAVALTIGHGGTPPAAHWPGPFVPTVTLDASEVRIVNG